MKAYLLAHWQTIATGILLIAFALLTGCTVMKTRPDLAKVGVTLAVAKFVENSSNPVERADKVRGIATHLLAVTDNAEMTVVLLKAEAIRRLPSTLTPVDRAIAVALIDAVAAELEARVAKKLLPEDRLLQIKTVLQWVIEGAGYVVPPGTEARPE